MSLFNTLSTESRKRKIELFFDHMKPNEKSTILDLGAQVGPRDLRQSLIDMYDWKENVVAADISQKNLDAVRKRYPHVHTEIADACNLQWPEKHFDIVYSNAVIEHVGDWARQKKNGSGNPASWETMVCNDAE